MVARSSSFQRIGRRRIRRSFIIVGGFGTVIGIVRVSASARLLGGHVFTRRFASFLALSIVLARQAELFVMLAGEL